MKILKLLENQRCSFCRKEKDEVCEVELERGRNAVLCWRDLQKMVRMTLKEIGDVPKE